jgi:hypothetical protein
MQLLPVLILAFPFLLIGFGFFQRPDVKNFSFICMWISIILGLWVWKDIPIISQMLVGLTAFIFPLFIVWKSSALLELPWGRRAQWACSGMWTMIWYLLFDKSGFSLITWFIVWPIVIQLFWKAYDSEEKDMRHLFFLLIEKSRSMIKIN